MDTFIPITEAASRLRVSVSELRHIVDSGKLKAVRTPLGVQVSEPGVYALMEKTELPEYQKHAHLAGKTISIGDASRMYDIPHPTISRWVSRGIIARLGTEKNRVLIDQADIAYCAEIYDKRGGQGRRIFNPDGTPYTSHNN